MTAHRPREVRLLERLPDSRVGSAIARVFCRAQLHSSFCRGTVTCARRRGMVRP